MRIARWIVLSLLALLAACAREETPTPAASPAPAATAAPATTAPPPAVAAPSLTYVVLADPGSDSPFRWEPVLAEGTRLRVEDGATWAPAAPVVEVLDPGARVGVVAGKLRIDEAVVDVPARDADGVAWASVDALARHFGALAYRHPDDGSIALWPAPMLHWLAANGDPKAPVLAQARTAGLLAPAAAVPAAATTLLRVRNTGPDAALSLRVQFPPGEVAFGDVRANSTTAYRQVPGGVYGYAAYRLRVDGREASVPVIDWVGEAPLEGAAFTYVVAVDARAPLPVTLVRVERDR
jgi:hypothetical protein